MKKEIKVAYFPPDTSKTEVIKYNGKSLDDFCIKCTVDEDFSNYTLDAMFLIKDNITDILIEEAILKVQLDYGKEIFRISKVKVDTRYIEVVARQITIADTKTLYLDDVEIVDKSAMIALNSIIKSSEGRGKDDITMSSDIEDIKSASYKMNNVYDAIQGSDENSFINKWGGEIQRRGYNIKIDNHIGDERGFTIREGKNLTGFTGDSSADGLITRAKGVGANGIEGDWIDSPLKNNYSRDYISTIKYDDVKVKSENDEEGYANVNEAKEELNRRIALEYSDSNIDKIKATYTINFVDLSKTVEYKNYIQAETVYLGDTIRVYIPRVNQDIFVRAISKSYNVLTQKTTEITLSNTITVKPLSSQQIISDLKEQYANKGNNIASYIDTVIKSGISDSYVVYRQNEILVMDNKDITQAVNVIRINKNGVAFSQTGYYGQYEYGFTIDGVINASLIRTGVLSAIKIQNIDSSFVMDLGKKGGMEFFIKGEKSLVIEKNRVVFYDNQGRKIIGGLLSLQRVNDNTKKVMVLGHQDNSLLTLDYYNAEDNTWHNYMKFDKYNEEQEYGYPISVHEDTDFFSRVCHYKPLEMKEAINFSSNDGSIHNGTIFPASDGNLVIGSHANSVNICYEKDGKYWNSVVMHRDDNATGGCYVDIWGETIFKNNTQTVGYSKYFGGSDNKAEAGRIFGSSNKNMIVSCNWDNKLKFCYEKNGSYYSAMELHRNDGISAGSNIDFWGDVNCYGGFNARSSKNRLVTTKNYGDRLLNAYETCSCYFGDIGKANTGKECRIKIHLDPIFLETVNTKEEYHVFLSKYGKGDIWTSELQEDYFIVESENPNLEFSFEIKAKQREYEDTRLEEYKSRSNAQSEPIEMGNITEEPQVIKIVEEIDKDDK